MKKKKRSNTPRRKRLDRKRRIPLAKQWIPTYEGQNIVKGYSKWFGVDLLCAITELRMAGEPIGTDYEEQVRRSIKDKIHQKQLKKEKSRGEQGYFEEEYGSPWDDPFDHVAGYTSAGFPYGIMEDELLESESMDVLFVCSDEDHLEYVVGYTSDGEPYGIQSGEAAETIQFFHFHLVTDEHSLGYYMDSKNILDASKEAGQLLEKRNIVIRSYIAGLSMELIASITKLSHEEIEKIIVQAEGLREDQIYHNNGF